MNDYTPNMLRSNHERKGILHSVKTFIENILIIFLVLTLSFFIRNYYYPKPQVGKIETAAVFDELNNLRAKCYSAMSGEELPKRTEINELKKEFNEIFSKLKIEKNHPAYRFLETSRKCFEEDFFVSYDLSEKMFELYDLLSSGNIHKEKTPQLGLIIMQQAEGILMQSQHNIDAITNFKKDLSEGKATINIDDDQMIAAVTEHLEKTIENLLSSRSVFRTILANTGSAFIFLDQRKEHWSVNSDGKIEFELSEDTATYSRLMAKIMENASNLRNKAEFR